MMGLSRHTLIKNQGTFNLRRCLADREYMHAHYKQTNTYNDFYFRTPQQKFT